MNMHAVMKVGLWACATLLLLPLPAQATLICLISTVPVLFGTYDVFALSPLDSTGSVTYSCTLVLGGTITIDLSRGNAASFQPRQMRQGSASLNYNLYRDAGATQIWGDGTGGTVRYGPVTPPESSPTTVPIFGRILPGQDVPIGSYSDTITATINF